MDRMDMWVERYTGCGERPELYEETSDEKMYYERVCSLAGATTLRRVRALMLAECRAEQLAFSLRDQLGRLQKCPVSQDGLAPFAKQVALVCDKLDVYFKLKLSCVREHVNPAEGTERVAFGIGTVVRHLWYLTLRGGTLEDMWMREALEVLFPGHEDACSFESEVLDQFSWDQWAAWSLVTGLVTFAVLGHALGQQDIVEMAYALLVLWENPVKGFFAEPSRDSLPLSLCALS
ncbi:hypothetical protein PWT90_11220 [Aphanocladium album]|nr:hypothetical protein PWT90_11220 [Aphanocladium album]